DQHVACGRCGRFGKVGKFEDDSRLAERSDLHGTHSAPPVSVIAEFDEVATGERTPGLLQAAARPPRSIAVKPKLSTSCLMNAVGSGWCPETKITRRRPFLSGPSLKRAVTIELNALTMRAPGARAATTSLAPLPPRSARTSFGLVSRRRDSWHRRARGRSRR